MTGTPESLNAVTLVTGDMAASVAFYETLGMALVFGGPEAPFSTLRVGPDDFLNLHLDPEWVLPSRVGSLHRLGRRCRRRPSTPRPSHRA